MYGRLTRRDKEKQGERKIDRKKESRNVDVVVEKVRDMKKCTYTLRSSKRKMASEFAVIIFLPSLTICEYPNFNDNTGDYGVYHHPHDIWI